jgi:hypothetical protein
MHFFLFRRRSAALAFVAAKAGRTYRVSPVKSNRGKRAREGSRALSGF